MLYRASLLIPDLNDTARIHRLVQLVTLHHLPPSDHDNRLEQAVQLLASLFPHDAWELDQWPRCDLLLPHAQAVLDHIDQQQRIISAAAVLLTTSRLTCERVVCTDVQKN